MRLFIVFVWVAVAVRASVYTDAAINELKETVKDDSDNRFLFLADDDKQHSNICKRCIKLPYKLQVSGDLKSVELTLSQLLKSVYIQGLTDTDPRRENVEGTFLEIVKSIQGLGPGVGKPKPSNGQQLGFLDSLCGLDIAGQALQLFGGVMKLFGEFNSQIVDSFITHVEKIKTERTNKEFCELKYYDELVAELKAFESKAKGLEKSAEDFLKNSSKVLLLLKLLYLNIAGKYLEKEDADKDVEQLKYRFVLLFDSQYISKKDSSKNSKIIFDKSIEKYHRGLTEEFKNKKPNVPLINVEFKLEELMAETSSISLGDPLSNSQNDKRSDIIKKIFVGLGFNENSYLV